MNRLYAFQSLRVWLTIAVQLAKTADSASLAASSFSRQLQKSPEMSLKDEEGKIPQLKTAMQGLAQVASVVHANWTHPLRVYSHTSYTHTYRLESPNKCVDTPLGSWSSL